MVLDGNLSRKSHAKYIVSKAGKRIRLLGRIREDLTTNAANLIFKSFILPILDYCDTVWACCNRRDIDQLERLQNRGGRIVMMTLRSAPALRNYKWDSLERRRSKHIFNLVHKCLLKKTPPFLHNYFLYNREINGRFTRQSNFLNLPNVRTETAQNSFFITVV